MLFLNRAPECGFAKIVDLHAGLLGVPRGKDGPAVVGILKLHLSRVRRFF